MPQTLSKTLGSERERIDLLCIIVLLFLHLLIFISVRDGWVFYHHPTLDSFCLFKKEGEAATRWGREK